MSSAAGAVGYAQPSGVVGASGYAQPSGVAGATGSSAVSPASPSSSAYTGAASRNFAGATGVLALAAAFLALA